MNKNEKLIAAKLLRLAADKFSNHGCNDFELEPTIENYELVKKVEPEYDPIIDTKKNILYIEDYLVMEYCAELLEQECENG